MRVERKFMEDFYLHLLFKINMIKTFTMETSPHLFIKI